MSNGGSPPAYLPSSYLSDPSWWLQFKWSQPPPRAPEWLFEYYHRYNPPANVGQPLRDEGWLQRAIREDQQAAGLLPPVQPGGPILLGARARAERAYRDWKAVIDDLWEDEYEALLVEQAACTCQEEATRHQRILDKHTAHACQQEAARQEAARAAQRFIQERAALERQQGEAAHRQRLLDEETACLRRAALARQTAAAQVIFLWIRRRRLFTRLACQTSRRLQHEAALARLQHEQECCVCAALAEAQRQQKSAARMKALADEADKRRRQVLAAATLADEQLCRGENERSPSATAAIVAAERVGREVAERTLRLATLALVAEQERREATKCALALATTALAAALKRQEAAERTSAMAISMLANVRKRQQAAERAQSRPILCAP
jgi:hypothetical protein